MEVAEEQAKQEEQILKYDTHIHSHAHRQNTTELSAQQSELQDSGCRVKYVTGDKKARKISADAPSVAH